MRRRTAEQTRHLIATQGDLTALTNHPAWPTLLKVVEEEREKLRRSTLAHVLGGVGPVDEGLIQRRRGFIGGMNYVLAVCAGAERRLEQVLQEGNRTEEAS